MAFTLAIAALEDKGTAASSSDAPSDSTASQEYAAYLGVDIGTADHYVHLTDSAASAQELLQNMYPDRFAGLWVDYKPTFQATVAHTGDASLDLTDVAETDFLEATKQVTVERSLDSLMSAAASIDLGTTEGATYVDVRSNQAVIEVLTYDAGVAQRAADAVSTDGSIRIDSLDRIPTPVANIYGGLDLIAWCGGLSGTSGFSVVGNTNEITGILTAGHLANCLKFGSTTLTFRAESNSGNADAQWHSSSTLTEQPWIHIGAETRTITGQRTYSSIVVGEMFCKYGRATGYGCGTVETKTVDPDAGGPLNAVFVRVAHCGVEDLAEPGDSGGPVFVGHAAVGIVTHSDDDIFCGGKMVFNSVTHSQSKLGITILFGS